VFRSAKSQDIDAIHQLIISEAAQGRFDPRLAEAPYQSALRKNLNNIRKRGRRLDEDVEAQLLVWETDQGEMAGCLINSAILPGLGNEIWMIAVLPAFRGKGEGTRMQDKALAWLHPRVDVFSRCAGEAQVLYQMNLRRGFLPLDVTDKGVRVMKLPKMGASLAGQEAVQQELEPFIKIPVG
jgi:N-acetylglutamate synthase-like GNAT family acetyltransferase